MTRKRLRYSELGTPAAAAVSATTPATIVPEPAEPVVLPARPRRNSTPVELARALAAARAAEQPVEATAAPVIARPSGPRARGPASPSF